MPTPALSFTKARQVIAEQMALLTADRPTETVPLQKALGRVLATDVNADRDYPPFNRSARDGFAVMASDVMKTPARLRVIGQTRAGEPSRFHLQHGEAVEIMTGAPGPKGSDSVVMWEYSQREGEWVTLDSGVPSGKNLIYQGSETSKGDTVLRPGTSINFPQMALLASVGQEEITVYRRPRVAILSTGDEVVELGHTPEPFQIRNSNAHSLAAQIKRLGGQPEILPIAPDKPDRTRDLIEIGLESDLLLLSGGVSMGKYDYVEQALTDLGAEFFFTQVKIQPGKPLVFGQVQSIPVFGLPGNPISTMVSFEVFASIAVHRLAGRSNSPLPFFKARLRSDFSHKPVLTRFLPARLEEEYGNTTVDPVKWQGSGDLTALALSNCFLVATPERASWAADDWIDVLPQ
ncbi:MAG: molybdopterin molybdenumtransferase MoeA [Solibacterales bacterium]|nr:molybdopterin molybdenumtransferase MoeA [Bryobacterales bacterium]|tara:strand:- start:32873 stop:34087 length:1215 start_codon:yes stop_codon:yes gene_type:complete